MAKRRDYAAERAARDYRAQLLGYKSYAQFRHATQVRPKQLRSLTDAEKIRRARFKNNNIDIVIPGFATMTPDQQAIVAEEYLLSFMTHDRSDEAHMTRARLVGRIENLSDWNVINWKAFRVTYNVNFNGGVNDHGRHNRNVYDTTGKVIGSTKNRNRRR